MDKFLNSEHEKAYLLLKNQDFKNALIIFDNLIYLFPDEPNLYGDRGVVHIHLNNKSEALNDFDKAVELDGNYGFRYASRAYAKDYFGDTAAAIFDYEYAIQLDPEDAISVNNLGLLQEKLGYQQKAKQNFEKADRLAKMNEAYDELVQTDNNIVQSEAINLNNESQRNDTSNSKSIRTEFFKIFKSRSQFKDFLNFIKKGGKI